jgi:hypothetical protein
MEHEAGHRQEDNQVLKPLFGFVRQEGGIDAFEGEVVVPHNVAFCQSPPLAFFGISDFVGIGDFFGRRDFFERPSEDAKEEFYADKTPIKEKRLSHDNLSSLTLNLIP